MKLRVREVDGQTYEKQLRCLHDSCFGDDAYVPDFSKGFWWVGLGSYGELAGFTGLVTSRRLIGWGYLIRTGVLPAFRGNGLHLRFIKVREKKARRLGWKGLVTDTTENHPSSNNLIAAGYKLYTPRTPWAFKNSLYWQKEL